MTTAIVVRMRRPAAWPMHVASMNPTVHLSRASIMPTVSARASKTRFVGIAIPHRNAHHPPTRQQARRLCDEKEQDKEFGKCGVHRAERTIGVLKYIASGACRTRRGP